MTVEEIYYRDATALAGLVRDGEVSPVEVVRAHLQRIEDVNGRLNAIVTLDDGAEDRAREAEAAAASGRAVGPAARRADHHQGLRRHRRTADDPGLAAVLRPCSGRRRTGRPAG